MSNKESGAVSCFSFVSISPLSIPVRLTKQDLQDDGQLLGGVLCVVAAHVKPHLESSKLPKEKKEGGRARESERERGRGVSSWRRALLHIEWGLQAMSASAPGHRKRDSCETRRRR